jgi:hypothetical protein
MLKKMLCPNAKTSDVEAEAEAETQEAVLFWWKQKRKWKRKRLKICRFCFHSVSKLLYEFLWIVDD